jgi:ketosteroid isomerase-like protein
MSEQDIQVVRDQFEATNKGDFARAMNYYADDVVLLVPPESVFPEAGTHTGKAAVGRWFGGWFQSFARGYRFRIEEARDLGEVIFVRAAHGGEGRTSGVEVQGENSYLYRVRDGKIVHIEFYATREEALEAAGVAE